MQAVLKGDSDTKLEELKKIVKYGEKLGKDVTPDKRKLEILLGREEKKAKSNQKASYEDDTPSKRAEFTLEEYLPKKSVSKNKEIKKEQIIEKKSENLEKDQNSEIKKISIENDAIKVDFNKSIDEKDIKYLTYKFNNNYENVIDISANYHEADSIKLGINNIDKLVIIPKNNNKSTRIKISDKNRLKISYVLKEKELIVKVKRVEELTKETKKEKKDFNNSSKNVTLPKIIKIPEILSSSRKTIVIDAGHGGHDPGAMGYNKRVEKVVTYEIAKMVYNKLKQNGHKVYLTRNKDKFIKVADRTVLANEKNADIFISIHCNSIVKSKANHIQGIETYFLSPARNERAKRVAEKENIEDTSGMSDSTKSAFLESLNRPRITASHKLSIDIHAGMLQNAKTMYKKVEDAGVKEGPFWVLVGAQMPSILIELGFISHPVESKRLYDKDYQQVLANGIANGIDSYFLKNP